MRGELGWVVCCLKRGKKRVHDLICYFVVSVVSAYRWSFSASSVRGCHWAYESACFLRALLVHVVDESNLPPVTNLRACLGIVVSGLELSGTKLELLRGGFAVYSDDYENPAQFEENFVLVQIFLLTVVDEVLAVKGLKEEVTFYLSICCPVILFEAEQELILSEASRFTELLLELNRITSAERRRMDRNMASFVTNYRNLMSADVLATAGSEIDLLRACNSDATVRFLRFLLCLCEGPQFPLETKCVQVGHLSSDVTSSVCATVLSYLKAHRLRAYESVGGPLLDDVSEAIGRIVDLSEFTEDLLWDDIGIVASEDYRRHMYEQLGYEMNGERPMSPEIGN